MMLATDTRVNRKLEPRLATSTASPVPAVLLSLLLLRLYMHIRGTVYAEIQWPPCLTIRAH